MVLRTAIPRFCLALALVTGLLFAYQPGSQRPASDLQFTLADGTRHHLTEYRGKVVALEFILTTCVHCQEASQVMNRLQADFASRGFQPLDLAINARDEGREPPAATALVAAFAEKFHVLFPVGWVPREQMTSFMGFSVVNRTMVPQLALVDRAGNIRFQTPPAGDSEAMAEPSLRSRIEGLLAERSRLPARVHVRREY